MLNVNFDHLVFAGPDLEIGIAYFEKLLGVLAVRGGSHPGLGTRNAYIGLGPSSYLEIIAPDPEQPRFNGVRPFNIDRLCDVQLITWVARQDNLSEFVKKASSEGIDLGVVVPVSRLMPNGEALNWTLTFKPTMELYRLIPFFIDWGTTPHPSKNCPAGVLIKSLVLTDPRPADLRRKLECLGLSTAVIEGASSSISVVIDSPNGEIELTSLAIQS